MNTVVKMILTLSSIGVISGGLLSRVNNWASPLIAANLKAQTEEAIFNVQPAAKTYELVKASGVEVYKVFGDDKIPLGYSLVYSGNGFQGKIRLMVGLSPDLEKITALEILEQIETPGLGTKVTEDHFRNQFKKLETSPMIILVKGVEPSKPNEIQAITGATISSKSVVAIVDDGISIMRELKKEGKI
ncbi:MAG: FMN-binding protein [Ignavibacteriaceae bacterium]|nr:FMN-binding protein [Ignavibacteriaceae bacterium]